MRPSVVPTYQSGVLFPICLCDDSAAVVQEQNPYKLEFGQKLCVPTQLKERCLRIEQGFLYLLWIFSTEADMRPRKEKSVETKIEAS